jgi:peroxiredoxin
MSALHGLQARIDDFRDANTRIIAISPDSQAENRKVAERLGLEFPILSDANLEVTRALGLVHEKGGMPPDFGDIPRPAVFIVEDGTVRWRAVTDNWRVRVRPEPLLAALNSVRGG